MQATVLSKKRVYSSETKVKDKERAKKNRQIFKEELEQLREIKRQYDDLINFKNLKGKMEKKKKMEEEMESQRQELKLLRQQNVMLESKLELAEKEKEHYKCSFMTVQEQVEELEGRLQQLTRTNMDLKSSLKDLILCKYSYNIKSKDHLDREYKHFIGQVGDKNDISFVVGAWLSLFKSNWFNGASTVKVWSDGGPKHFKISANMKFFMAIQQATPEVKWVYNFFASYHGCSICDGVAAQAKGAINRTMRDIQLAIRTTPEAIKVVGKLGNHVASTVAIVSNDFSTPTLQGIKSFHKFEADAHKNFLYAYRTSEDSKWEKRYCPQDVLNLLDLLQ